ncbi:ZIP family metal transporter [Aneurinibacillus migulanus]|uniref:ZIP family metal transporter n=1 Tax=Aneurinibacillus migulanus TaxID=47500 RepID=UPI0006971202|nr:ZIP family metal transporter [Aneurinibacillus migulanus]CEH30718.1 Metal cation transporter, ZIP family [Aneurinibacillus migulanus]
MLMNELLLISMGTGLTTVIGALLTLVMGMPGRRLMAFYLGMSAGIMALVILADLLPAALQEGKWYGVLLGMSVGVLLLRLLHHNRGAHESDSKEGYKRTSRDWRGAGWLMAAALALHHVPEGIAIGAGFQAHHSAGVMIALSMSLHNIPEGIGLAAPFLLGKMRRRSILLLAFLISLSIPAGAWLGGLYFMSSPEAITFGMSFAIGAMAYLVWKELGPTGLAMHRLSAQFGMLLSLIAMALLHLVL